MINFNDESFKTFVRIGLISAVAYAVAGPIGLGLVALYFICK